MCDLHDAAGSDPSEIELLHHDPDGDPAAAPATLNRRLLLRTAGVAGLGLGLAGVATVPALAAGRSQNGWSGITSSGSSALNRGFSAAGVAFPGGVRRGDAGTVLHYVAVQFHRHVERLHPGWCWGWAHRDIRGGSTLSNHASATAIDVNAPRHPIGKSGTFGGAQRRQIQAILNTCEGTVRWGGNYSGRKDEMHFEINVGPGSSKLARVARKVGGSGGGGGNDDPPDSPSYAFPTLRKGSDGYRVRALQYLLRARGYRLVVDGDFGPRTKAAVVAFQGRSGLVRDGIVGRRTWPKLVVSTRMGSKGNAVKAVQRTLRAHGYGLVVDGDFGSRTRAAVVDFQRRKKLVADGIAGPKTWAALV